MADQSAKPKEPKKGPQMRGNLISHNGGFILKWKPTKGNGAEQQQDVLNLDLKLITGEKDPSSSFRKITLRKPGEAKSKITLYSLQSLRMMNIRADTFDIAVQLIKDGNVDLQGKQWTAQSNTFPDLLKNFVWIKDCDFQWTQREKDAPKKDDTTIQTKPSPMKANPRGWNCPECIAENDETNSNCFICKASKPLLEGGSEPATPETPKSVPSSQIVPSPIVQIKPEPSLSTTTTTVNRTPSPKVIKPGILPNSGSIARRVTNLNNNNNNNDPVQKQLGSLPELIPIVKIDMYNKIEGCLSEFLTTQLVSFLSDFKKRTFDIMPFDAVELNKNQSPKKPDFYPNQEFVGNKILDKLDSLCGWKNSNKWRRFKFIIVIPPRTTLRDQIFDKLNRVVENQKWNLPERKFESIVVFSQKSESNTLRVENWTKLFKSDPDCLFLVIQDECNFEIEKNVDFSEFSNNNENVFLLQISGTPNYNLHNDFENVVNWETEANNHVDSAYSNSAQRMMSEDANFPMQNGNRNYNPQSTPKEKAMKPDVLETDFTQFTEIFTQASIILNRIDKMQNTPQTTILNQNQNQIQIQTQANKNNVENPSKYFGFENLWESDAYGQPQHIKSSLDFEKVFEFIQEVPDLEFAYEQFALSEDKFESTWPVWCTIIDYCTSLVSVVMKHDSLSPSPYSSKEVRDVWESILTVTKIGRKRIITSDPKMAVVRIQLTSYGKIFANLLTHYREKLGLQKSFAIIETGGKGFGDLKNFITGGIPEQFSDLDGIPCILIVTEKARMGDTFPPSFAHLDLRSRYRKDSDKSKIVRSNFDQDIGRAFGYGASPTVLVSKHVFDNDQKYFSPNLENEDDDFDNDEDDDFAQAYKANAIFRTLDSQRRILLAGHPRIGKTGAYLFVVNALIQKLNGGKLLEMKPRPKQSSEYWRKTTTKWYTLHSSEVQKELGNVEINDDYHEWYEDVLKQQWKKEAKTGEFSNPVDGFIELFKRNKKSKPTKKWIVGDFGCGSADFAREFVKDSNVTVLNFDFCANRKARKNGINVIEGDISQIDQKKFGKLDIAIFSLSLMANNWSDFLRVACSMINDDGVIWIAEMKPGDDFSNCWPFWVHQIGLKSIQIGALKFNNRFFVCELKKADILHDSQDESLPFQPFRSISDEMDIDHVEADTKTTVTTTTTTTTSTLNSNANSVLGKRSATDYSNDSTQTKKMK